MTKAQIIAAINDGKHCHWRSSSYTVINRNNELWTKCLNGSMQFLDDSYLPDVYVCESDKRPGCLRMKSPNRSELAKIYGIKIWNGNAILSKTPGRIDCKGNFVVTGCMVGDRDDAYIEVLVKKEDVLAYSEHGSGQYYDPITHEPKNDF